MSDLVPSGQRGQTHLPGMTVPRSDRPPGGAFSRLECTGTVGRKEEKSAARLSTRIKCVQIKSRQYLHSPMAAAQDRQLPQENHRTRGRGSAVEGPMGESNERADKKGKDAGTYRKGPRPRRNASAPPQSLRRGGQGRVSLHHFNKKSFKRAFVECVMVLKRERRKGQRKNFAKFAGWRCFMGDVRRAATRSHPWRFLEIMYRLYAQSQNVPQMCSKLGQMFLIERLWAVGESQRSLAPSSVCVLWAKYETALVSKGDLRQLTHSLYRCTYLTTPKHAWITPTPPKCRMTPPYSSPYFLTHPSLCWPTSQSHAFHIKHERADVRASTSRAEGYTVTGTRANVTVKSCRQSWVG
jgi:hypothetical protein